MPPSPTQSCFLEKKLKQPRSPDGAGATAVGVDAWRRSPARRPRSATSPCSSQSARSSSDRRRVAAEVHGDHRLRARRDPRARRRPGRGSGRRGRRRRRARAWRRRSAARARWRRTCSAGTITSSPGPSPAASRRGAARRCRSRPRPRAASRRTRRSASSNAPRARAHRQPAGRAGTRARPATSSSGHAMSVSGTRQLIGSAPPRAPSRRGPARRRSCAGRAGCVSSVRAAQLGARQRDAGEALAVGRELVDRRVEDAGLDAALSRRCGADVALAAGLVEHDRHHVARRRWPTSSSRNGTMSPSHAATAARGSAASARGGARCRCSRRAQAREQQRRARLVEPVVEAEARRRRRCRCACCGGPRCPMVMPCERERASARRRRRRRCASRPPSPHREHLVGEEAERAGEAEGAELACRRASRSGACAASSISAMPVLVAELLQDVHRRPGSRRSAPPQTAFVRGVICRSTSSGSMHRSCGPTMSANTGVPPQ